MEKKKRKRSLKVPFVFVSLVPLLSYCPSAHSHTQTYTHTHKMLSHPRVLLCGRRKISRERKEGEERDERPHDCFCIHATHTQTHTRTHKCRQR